ncbi:hypothetical protein [Nocardia sp. NPDC052112]|uniref:hypothetical protein n=1 Tax=Nocardia sp. NPDC052112 TaxID=3155646 RepID=UPI0034307F0E
MTGGNRESWSTIGARGTHELERAVPDSVTSGGAAEAISAMPVHGHPLVARSAARDLAEARLSSRRPGVEFDRGCAASLVNSHRLGVRAYGGGRGER